LPADEREPLEPVPRLLRPEDLVHVRLAGYLGVKLRQSYKRVGKFALIKHQRYAHARQFKRARRCLRTLKTCLGRVIRDIERKIAENPYLQARFALLLRLARGVQAQERGQRGPKVYSLHAPEVECIGKGKPHKPYEFGVKVRIATTLKHARGGQFVLHAQDLPATLMTATRLIRSSRRSRSSSATPSSGLMSIPAIAATTLRPPINSRSTSPSRSAASRRRSNARCGAAIEPVIGHLKNEHRMDRNDLHHRSGDANNAVLAAIDYNFRRPIRWLTLLSCPVLAVLRSALISPTPARKPTVA
jgi:transposase, IS5 family